MPAPSIDWTDARKDELRALWAEGHPAAEIGRRMGITANAVVGKAHRMGLAARPSPIVGRGQDAQARLDHGLALVEAGARVCDAARQAGVATAYLQRAVQDARSRAHPGPHVAAAEQPSKQPGSAPTPDRAAGERSPPRRANGEGSAARVPPALPGTGSTTLGRAALPADAARQASPPDRSGRATRCCWPEGDPRSRDFRYCDAPAQRGRPYCEAHAAVAFLAVRDRREDHARAGVGT